MALGLVGTGEAALLLRAIDGREIWKGPHMSHRLLLESHSYPHQGGGGSIYPCEITFPISSLYEMGMIASEAKHVLLKACGVHIDFSTYEEGIGVGAFLILGQVLLWQELCLPDLLLWLRNGLVFWGLLELSRPPYSVQAN